MKDGHLGLSWSGDNKRIVYTLPGFKSPKHCRRLSPLKKKLRKLTKVKGRRPTERAASSEYVWQLVKWNYVRFSPHIHCWGVVSFSTPWTTCLSKCYRDIYFKTQEWHSDQMYQEWKIINCDCGHDAQIHDTKI